MTTVSIADYRSSATMASEVVVDLSQHIDKLMAYEDISDDLTREEEARVVDYVRSCIRMSHQRISKRYDFWKEADRAHDVYVSPDATRFREKAVIADTRAVADTVVTYLMSALTGRNPMFQLVGSNRKSKQPARLLEQILHQHMRRGAGEALLAQHLRDSVRYGFAPTKVIWSDKDNTNLIVPFDPRRVFPDPRVSWGDWDKMGFVVFTEHASYTALRASGLYPKLSQYPALRYRTGHNQSGWDAHRWARESGRGLSLDPSLPSHGQDADFWTLGDARVVDEIWFRLSGYEINIPGIEEIWLLATIIDESVVIRFQLSPMGRQFPFVAGALHHDRHKTYGEGLYDVLMPMHNIATWLLRSRIDNVQAALSNLIFADPTQIAMSDLIDRNPWGIVRTLPGVKPGDGVFIAQVPDVTRGHWQDIRELAELSQRVAAASDLQQGMPTGDGIRTATEIQRLSQLGSQRLGLLARVVSATSVRPMIRMMVSNIQDALSMDGSIPMDERTAPKELLGLVSDDYLDFDHSMLQGDVDYYVVDGTLPIEPARQPEVWMNMLQVMAQTGLNMEFDMAAIAEEAIRSMGIPDLDQYRVKPENGLLPNQEMALMEKQRGTSVLPEEQLMREREKGNLVGINSR